jgi:hypothetical protein
MAEQELNVYSDFAVRDLTQVAYDHWLKCSRLITVQEIIKSRDWNPLAVAAMLDSEDFKRSVLAAGIPWVGSQDTLTTEQHYVINIVLDPTNKGSLKNRLDKAGVTYAKWQGWMKQPAFKAAVNRLFADTLENVMPSIQNSLINQAERGNMHAIKFVYELTKRWDPNGNNSQDLVVLIGQVIEIVTKHVTDPDTLVKIGSELQGLSMRALGENYGNIDNQTRVIEA